MRSLAVGRLVAVFLLLIVPGAAMAQVTHLPRQLNLSGGEVIVYESDKPIARVAVGNGELIEVTTIQKRQLVVIAGADASGFTALHLWFEDGSQRSLDVVVNAVDSTGILVTVREMLGPGSAARLVNVDGNVVVYGELTAPEAMRLETIKNVFPNVVDLTHPDLVNMQPMVVMDVRIMEFKRSALRQLGIRWDSVIDGPSAGAIKDISDSFYRILPEGSPFLDITLPARINPLETYFGIATSITSRINLLTQSGDAYELASPQLSARSGGEANFLAGGQVPIPVTGGFGSTNVEFKDYGIKLHIEPIVNSNNEISTYISTEVSKIDPSVSVQGIPGFLTRKTDTEINVRAGQTIVISGLVDIQGSDGYSGIPGLSSIPIIGRLFRSDDFRAGRTDLVIFVTPRIVEPGSPSNIEAIEKSNRLLEDFKKAINADIFD